MSVGCGFLVRFACRETVGMTDMKILLAIDSSKFSELAIQSVIARGRGKDTEVRVLHVVEPPSLLVLGDMGGYDPDLELR
jgi:nucleotide-binding universal stress UspA family protein